MANETTYDQHPPDREVGPTVLIVDDEALAQDRLNLALCQIEGANQLHILHARSLVEAIDILTKTLVHVVLLDKNLGPEPVPANQNGIEGIPSMLRLQPHLQILMVTGSNDIQDVVRAMNFGACGYITKEMPNSLLVPHIARAIDVSLLQLDKLRRDRFATDAYDLGGKSKLFTEIKKAAQILAESNRPILMLGQTGTGKTELAKFIHYHRGRYLKQKDRPFIFINMTTLSRDLIESELFGHEKGSFTGAQGVKQGLFELASNGTLLLDEIGEFPLDLQAKLLTVIEEGSFKRVGSEKILYARPKIIFATNRDLEQMVRDGTFREDLFMRISMFPITMPSILERKEDIPDIVRALLPKACAENHISVTFDEIPQDFIEHLATHPVDGNIRGILNQLERLLVLSPKDKRGRPVLSQWQSISGLSPKRRSLDMPTYLTAKMPLTYRELMSRPWNLLGADFPGLNEMLEQMKDKLFQEAQTKFKTNRALAQVFKISESTASLLVKRHAKERTTNQSAQAGVMQ